MTTDLTDDLRCRDEQVVHRLRDFIDSLEADPSVAQSAGVEEVGDRVHLTAPPPGFTVVPDRPRGNADRLDAPAARRRARRRALRRMAMSVAAILVLLATVFGTTRLITPAPQPATGRQVELPAELPAYRHLRIPLALMPPGRVLLSYQHGGGYEFLDLPRNVVLAPDGTTARWFRTPETRHALGRNGPTRVSPDGSTLAVGTYGWTGDVVLVDAASGRERTVTLTTQQYRSAVPLSWSPDGAWLYALDYDAAQPSGTPGIVHRVEVATGRVQAVPGLAGRSDVRAVFQGARGRLLVMRLGGIDLRDSSGGLLRSYPSIAGAEYNQNAWSRDGRYLMTAHARVHVLDLATGQVHTIELPNAAQGLGWASARTIVIEEWVPHGGARTSRLTEVDILTGERWVVSRWPDSWTGAPIINLAMAADLAWHWRVERAPWSPPPPGG